MTFFITHDPNAYLLYASGPGPPVRGVSAALALSIAACCCVASLYGRAGGVTGPFRWFPARAGLLSGLSSGSSPVRIREKEVLFTHQGE